MSKRIKIGRPPLTEKRKLVDRMRKLGKSFSEIALILGGTRQAIHKMYHRYR